MNRSAGYSGKPLAAKLGIKPGFRISLTRAPDHYISMLGKLPSGTKILDSRTANLDLLHVFSTSPGELVQDFPRAKRRIKPDGTVWVSWSKQSSPFHTTLNENIVRDIGLANGLVDVKVAAIDENWSGLKFVYRLKDRPQRS
jgi:hypothetical protein